MSAAALDAMAKRMFEEAIRADRCGGHLVLVTGAQIRELRTGLG